MVSKLNEGLETVQEELSEESQHVCSWYDRGNNNDSGRGNINLGKRG